VLNTRRRGVNQGQTRWAGRLEERGPRGGPKDGRERLVPGVVGGVQVVISGAGGQTTARRCQYGLPEPGFREKLPLENLLHHQNLVASPSTSHEHANMKLSNQSAVPVYTIAGSNTSRPLPDWLVRKRKRSLKQDPEFANRVELLQDFEFEEASSCVRVSEDGDWVMSTGRHHSSLDFSQIY